MSHMKAILQETFILDVTEEIWRVMEERNVSKADLAKALDCSKAHITQLLNGNHNMTLRTLCDISCAMRTKPVIKLEQKVPASKEQEFLQRVLLTNPETGERLDITKTEGTESGHDCLQITVEGLTGAFVHEIRTREI